MSKTELVVLGSNHATAMSVLANELASKADDVLDSTLDELAVHKEEWSGGRVTVLFAMREVYGEEAVTKFPDPAVLTGDQPAKWKTKVKGTNGKDVTRTVDFYDLFTNGTKAGVRLQQEKQWLARLTDEHDNGKGIPADFVAKYGDTADFAERKRADRLDWINGRLSTMKNCYRNAIALMHQMQRVLDLDGVNCDFLYTDDTETEVVRGDEKIVVWKIPAEGKGIVTHSKRFTLGSFMRLNALKASESDNAYDALIASIKRDKSSDNTANENSEARSQHIATTDTAHARTSDLLGFFDDAVSDKTRAKLQNLRKAMRPGEGDGFFMDAYALMLALKDVIGSDADAVRYEKLRQDVEKAAA